MRPLLSLLIFSLLLVPVSAQEQELPFAPVISTNASIEPSITKPPAPAKADPLALKAKWKNGPFFYTEDEMFTFRPGGRFQFDTVFTALTGELRRNITGPSAFEDGIVIRRARFAMDGTMNKTIEYRTEFDFSNAFITQVSPQRETTVVAPTEMNLTFRELPIIGNIRVGNQKQPYSFEHTTSSKYLNFLERSTGFDAFSEGFNNGFTLGVQAFDNFLPDNRGFWAIGIFKSTRSPFGFNVGRNEADLNGRTVVLPVYENKGESLIHLGMSGSYRDLDQDQQRYRSRLGARSGPGAISDLISDTGFLFGSREARTGFELAGVLGAFSFQGEQYLSWLMRTELPVRDTRIPLGTTFYHGGYFEVHYFLTGEHREYDHERMAFTRVTPINPISWTGEKRGLGAWQLALRYGYLDFNDKQVVGGISHEFVVGLNWFLTSNVKFQSNYVLTSRDVAGTSGDGLIHGFGIRTAWDF